MRKLLAVLQRLVDLGNTVLIIEHNLDVIKQADWLIDLGLKEERAGDASLLRGRQSRWHCEEILHGQAIARTLLTNGSGVAKENGDLRFSKKTDRFSLLSCRFRLHGLWSSS